MKKILIIAFIMGALSINLLANALEDLPLKYFSYSYIKGSVCKNLCKGINNAVYKDEFVNSKEMEVIKLLELNNDFARVLIKTKYGKSVLILVSNIPACYGLKNVLH